MLVVWNCAFRVPFLRGDMEEVSRLSLTSLKSSVLATVEFSEPSPSLVAQRACSKNEILALGPWLRVPV